MDKAYSVSRLAERWSVSTDTIYAMIHSGRLKAFRFGGKLYRIRPDEVERFETQPVEAASERGDAV